MIKFAVSQPKPMIVINQRVTDFQHGDLLPATAIGELRHEAFM